MSWLQVAHAERFMISVVAEGAEPLEYSWLHNGLLVEGHTSSELVVARALKASHQGLYKAVVGPVFLLLLSQSGLGMTTPQAQPRSKLRWSQSGP